MVVGGDQWEEKNNPVVKKWISRDYKSIQMESGRNAEQRKKQKMSNDFSTLIWKPLEKLSKYDSSIASQLSEQAHINVSFPYFPFSCMP